MPKINKQNDLIIKLAFDEYMRALLDSIPHDLTEYAPSPNLDDRLRNSLKELTVTRRWSRRRMIILVAAIILLACIAVSVCIAYQWPYPRRGRSFDMSISSEYNDMEQSELTFTRPENDKSRTLPPLIETVYAPQYIPEGCQIEEDISKINQHRVTRGWTHGKYILSYSQYPISLIGWSVTVPSAKHTTAEFFDMDGYNAVYITHTSKSKYSTGNTLIWNDGSYAYVVSDDVMGKDEMVKIALSLREEKAEIDN